MKEKYFHYYKDKQSKNQGTIFFLNLFFFMASLKDRIFHQSKMNTEKKNNKEGFQFKVFTYLDMLHNLNKMPSVWCLLLHQQDNGPGKV